jgi:hypothetical protein
MSWSDDISSSDSMLPLFGFSGVVILLIIGVVAYYTEKDAIKNGVLATVVSIGTCHDDSCGVKVESGGQVLERETGSKVFIGDKLQCGGKRCYKE